MELSRVQAAIESMMNLLSLEFDWGCLYLLGQHGSRNCLAGCLPSMRDGGL